MTTAKKGDKVQVHYTGKLKDGSTFDSSEGRAPLSFTLGNNEVIPGFENAIEGMKVKDKKTFTIESKDAYGLEVKELVMDIPKSKLPPKPEPQVGMMLMMRDPSGRQIPAKIAKIGTETVTIDLNHPLAGKDLTFQIELVGINLPEQESAGCGGCCSECHGSCGSDCDDPECSDAECATKPAAEKPKSEKPKKAKK